MSFLASRDIFPLRKLPLIIILPLLVAFSNNNIVAQVTYTQGFESNTVSPWTSSGSYGSYLFTTTSGVYPSESPHGGSYQLEWQSFNAASGDAQTLYSPVVDYSGRGSNTPTVSFWFYRDNTAYTSGYNSEGVTVYVSTGTSGGTSLGYIPRVGTVSASGAYLATTTNLAPSTTGWYQYTFNIPASYNTATNHIILSFYSQYGDNCYLDDISYVAYPSPCTTAGVWASWAGTVGSCTNEAAIAPTCYSQTLSVPSTGYTYMSLMGGRSYTFSAAGGSGWSTPFVTTWYLNSANTAWIYMGGGANSCTITTPSSGNYTYAPAGAGDSWQYLVEVTNGNSCTINSNPWPGTSAVLTYKENGTSAPASPVAGTAGSNSWNVYAYNTGDLSLSTTTYLGYYTTSGLTYSTLNEYNNNEAPSFTPSESLTTPYTATVTAYQGCNVNNNYHTVQHVRQGFPCGIYKIDIADPANESDGLGMDDNAELLLNGSQIWGEVGCCSQWINLAAGNTGTNIGAQYIFLGSSDKLDMRHLDGCGGSEDGLVFTSESYTALSASVASAQTLCYGGTPSTISATAAGGTVPYYNGGSYSYQWQSSPDNSTWSNVSGATASTYAPGSLTTTTYYRVLVSDKCTSNTASGSVKITIYGSLSASLSGGSTNICYNTTPTAFTATGSGGTGSYTYLWYKNSTSTGITTSSYSPGNLTAGITVYCAVTSGSCGTANTGTYTVAVDASLSATLTGGSTNLCYNTSPTAFTATGSGGTGSYTYLWYINSSSSGITTSTYSPGNLTASSTVYCAVTSGSCGTVNTVSYNIAVDGSLSAGVSGGSTNICYNTTPTSFTATASGGTGSYTYLWYINSASSGITTSTYSPGNLTTTSTVYCAVTSGSCGTANTGSYTVAVYGNLTAGQSGGSSPVCYNTAPGTFTVSGSGGTGSYTYLWYKNGTSTGIATNTYAPGNLTATSTIYCAVTSGTCGTVNTTGATITVYGNFTASQSGGSSPLCYNSSPGTFTVSASGGTGTYTYMWYLNGSPSGATTTTYAPGSLTGTSTIYCAVTSGSCGTVNTTGAAITVYGNLSAAQTGGSSPVCYNNSPGTFTSTASGGTGTYTYQWYTGAGSIGGATASTYFPGNITATTSYYAAVTSGSCGTVNTTGTNIAVYPNLTATLTGGSSPVCYNTSPGTYTATGSGGNSVYTYQWFNSSSSITGATVSTYTPPSLTSNNSYYCAITSGAGCGTLNSSTASVTVEPPVSSYGTVSASGGLNQTVCDNVAPNSGNPLVVSGAAGSSGSFTYQWYYQNGLIAAPSGSSTAGWTLCSSTQGTGYTTANFTASGGSNNITYACFVIPSNPVCGSGQWATNDVQVTVLTTGPQETSTGGANVCLNGSVLLSSNLSVVIPATYQWYSSTSAGFGSPTAITGATSTTYAPPTSSPGTLYYEIVATFSGSGCAPATSNAQTVTAYTVPSASISGGISPICYNTSPGTFTAAGIGGSGSFNYQWYNSAGSVSGATNGTYNPGNITTSDAYHCSVTDVAGCGSMNTSTTSITVYGNLTAVATGGLSPICYNTSPGIFTATASGATGVYTYQWYNGSGSISGATSSTFNPGNLTASNAFFCAVTSGTCGTINTSIINITVHANLTAGISGGTSPICYNTAPGTFRVIASGGSGTYTYQWFNTSGSVTGATASTYAPGNITSSDAYHCNVTGGTCGSVNTATISITVYPNLTAAISGGTTPICNNTSPGTLTAAGTGGTGSYTYQWYNSSGAISGATGTTYTPGNLAASVNYTCSITSGSCGTVASNNIAITVDAVISATITGGTTPICFNSSPGTFTATGTGGTGSYTYQWYNGGGAISGATDGTYAPGNLTVSNSYHCEIASGSCGTVSTSISSITVDAVLGSAIAGGISPVCYNTSPGVFTATGSGGTGSYTYQWYNSSGTLSGQTASTLTPGNLTASDNFHCEVSSGSCGTANTPSASIMVNPQINAATITGTNVLCHGASNGTINVSTIASGGTAPFAYSLNSGAYQSGLSFTGLSPASYTVVARDALGCISSSSNSISITEPAVLTAPTISNTNVLCNGSANGTVTVSTLPGGGTSPYTYSLNGSAYQSGTGFTGLAPGSYSMVSKDANACISPASNSVTVSEPTPLGNATISSTDVVCYNASNGTVTVSTLPVGGTTPYTYSLNGGTYQSSTTFTSLAPGTYSVLTKDANGCLSSPSNSVIISQPSATTATASNNGPYVAGQTIVLLASSSGAVTYQWSGPQSFFSNAQNPSITGAATNMSGNYTVTATSTTGCTATATTNLVVTTSAAYTWTGTNSTDWTDPGNWSPPAPVGGPDACAIDVVIPNTANAPVISSGVQVGNVQINTNAQLTLNSANINVCKNWVGSTGNAAVVTGTGTIVLNGSIAQTISGSTQMNELMVDNTSGVNMLSGSAVDIFTSLDLASGNFNATNGALTFKSQTIDSVGIIDNFSSGYTGTLTGNITAERYYANSHTYDQHFMGSPINSPALSQFNASGTPGFVQDPWCDETRLAHTSPYGTVFSFHETNGASCGLNQWKVETTGNAQNGMGYSLLRAGDGTLVLNGAPNLNSSYSVSGLTNGGWSNTTVQHHLEGSGWQLVSNPYLATLNLTDVPAGFDNQVQVWNANGPFAGSYQPGTIGSDAVIAPFQAFMVHKTSVGGTATYVINASERVRTQHIFYLQNANQLNIVATNTANGKLDQTSVAFNPDATDTFDVQFDAAKFPGLLDRHTLYTENNGKWMSRNTLHNIATTSTVPMGFEPGANGTYKLSFNDLNTFDPTNYIYLEDKTLGVMHNVRNGDYIFTADSADNWDRFVLHFTPAAQIATTDATCTTEGVITIQQPGTADWNYTLTDASNAIITSGILNQSQQVNIGVAAGTYLLTLIDTNNYSVTKTIIVNGAEMVTAAFNMSNDVIQVGQNVTLSAPPAAAISYNWNFGNGTSGTGPLTSVSYTQPGVYTISLSVTNQSGCSATKTQTITVTSAATGLNNVTGTGNLKIWSHDNKVYVDFTGRPSTDAVVIIYDILGQEISNEKVTNNTVYQREIDNIEAAYMIIMVKNENEITTKKVFITNLK